MDKYYQTKLDEEMCEQNEGIHPESDYWCWQTPEDLMAKTAKVGIKTIYQQSGKQAGNSVVAKINHLDGCWEEYKANMRHHFQNEEEYQRYIEGSEAEYAEMRRELLAQMESSLNDAIDKHGLSNKAIRVALKPDNFEPVEMLTVSTNPDRLDMMFMDAVAKAADQTMKLVEARQRAGAAYTVHAGERVGMFSTNLRRELNAMGNVSREVYSWVAQIHKPNNWSDVGQIASGSYKGDWNCTFDTGSGVWHMNVNKGVTLCARAMMSVNYVPDDKALDVAITNEMASLERGMDDLSNKLRLATQLNDQADTVSGDLMKIAEDIQTALEAA